MSRRSLSSVAATLGSAGGKAGTGESKKRSPAHYRRMVKIRLAAAKKKKSEA